MATGEAGAGGGAGARAGSGAGRASAAVDLLITGAAQILTLAGGEGPLVGSDLREIHPIENGAVIASGGRIEWVGPTREAGTRLAGRPVTRRLDATGRVVMPAFVDCHTHVPFARGRQAEFQMRIEGRSYLEIARAGGGILNSVKHFRQTTSDDLMELNRRHLERMLAAGSVTIECKSGYGLALEPELRALEVIGRLDAEGPWRLVPTFLGAHMIPAEFHDDRAGYVDLLINEMIPAVAAQGIARYCDVFIEETAFTVGEGRRILEAALAAGLAAKLHVDEFNALGGSGLAAELHAVSADHLDRVTDEEMAALARSGTVGVLMPGVNYFLGNHDYAPARRLIDAGVPVALATDFNPGSCMCHAMEMILSLACTQLRMLPAEAVAAATRNAAHACGEGRECGRLEPGCRADILVMDTDDYRTIPYHFGSSHVGDVIVGGTVQPTRPGRHSGRLG